jgi:hypothetical protein
MVIDEIKKIREMIQHPCNVVMRVPYIVKYYRDVVKEWNYYKKTGTVNYKDESKKIHIERIFNFHLNSKDHILLYYSHNQINCLWMCKVDNKYINILVPADTLKTKTHSIIATYTYKS